MKKYALIFFLALLSVPALSQRVLSLDSCRVMALQGNKQLAATRLGQDVARDVRKAARTQYLPKVDALGGYSYMSREVSILNDDQKSSLGNLGTNAMNGLNASGVGTQLAQILANLGMNPAQVLPAVAASANQFGQGIVDAFRTDTRSMWAGTVQVRQPLYMGGAIMAANKMAKIGGTMADTRLDQQRQATLYDIDKTYWLVVSLRQKQRLAESFRTLVGHLDEDVHKMIGEGVATRADGLKVDVRVNEADMTITEVENGLSLSRMLLCQLCGMPVDTDFVLEDEAPLNPSMSGDSPLPDLSLPIMGESDGALRPELRLLESAVDLSHASEKLVMSAYLPHVGVVGGYTFSNPNVFNGFEQKVGGFWNVGVIVHVPVWNWMEGKFKVRAARSATQIARLTLDEAREKINLQVAQSRFKVTEAEKRLQRARKNIESAEENLRCANAGFHEGVMEISTVMEAQTAWQQAQSQKIDAEIDLKMARTTLQKALGTLGKN